MARRARRTSRRPRRTSRRPRRRTSRGMEPNIAPDALQVPPPGGQHPLGQWDWWLSQTFSPGTPVMTTDKNVWLFDSSAASIGKIPEPGARAVVIGPPQYTGTKWRVEIEVVDARDAAGQIDDLIGKQGWVNVEWNRPSPGAPLRWYGIEPLVDNWYTVRQAQGRQHLPRSQRSWMKPNPIPPPPQNQRNQWAWFLRTFPVGTSIEWRKDQPWAPGGGINVTLPRGIKAEIISHDPTQYGGMGGDGWIVARFLKVIPGVSDAAVERFAHDLGLRTGKTLHELDFGLELKDAVSGMVWPLSDTWAAAQQPYTGRPMKPAWVRPNEN